MPQITPNTANIDTFGFSVKFDIANQSVVFDISKLTVFNGSGGTLIQGINFALNDASGNPLIPGNLGNGTWDWTDPNITDPSTDANPVYMGQSTFTLDMNAIFGNNYGVLFQNYGIQGAIKDQNGTVYETTFFIQKVCQPKGLTDLGYILGVMTITADCPNNMLTVKEVTNTTYDGLTPTVLASTGILYYPRGTVANIPYSFADETVNFTNNTVYTGNYKIQNTTTAQYYYNNDVIVQLEYYTDSEKYNITCEQPMNSVLCCFLNFNKETTAICTGADYAARQAQMVKALVPMIAGLIKQSAGQDASLQAQEVRKILNCNCDDDQILHVSQDPVNPLVYNITMTGLHGTAVNSSVVGNTKIFTVDSDVYIVQKADNTDASYTIEVVDSTPGIVRYKLSFDYASIASKVAQYINGGQLKLGTAITVCSLDYAGNKVETVYPADTYITAFLTAISTINCSIIDKLDVIFSITAINGLNETLDGDGNPVIKLGGNLIQSTTIPLGEYYFRFTGDAYNSFYLSKKLFVNNNSKDGDLTGQIFSPGDVLSNVLFRQTAKATGESMNVGFLDVASVTVDQDANGGRFTIGINTPDTADQTLFPAPARNVNTTALIRGSINGGGFASIEYYSKYAIHTGELDQFNTYVALKSMTTAEIAAIPALDKVLGMAVYNSTLNCWQQWDGTRFVSLMKCVKATATLDFGSTAAQTSSSLTAAVPGAVAGDNVVVCLAVGSFIVGGILTGFVSAPDVVTVTLNNFSASPIDPASLSFNITVIKQ